MFKTIFWYSKISDLKEKLTTNRNMWIELVKRDYLSSSKVLGDTFIEIEDDFLETCVFPISAYQMVTATKIALTYGLLSEEDAKKFFPMLAEEYCKPSQKKYNPLITRYAEAGDETNQLTKFTFDFMACMLGKGKGELIGSVFLCTGSYVLILDLLTQYTFATVFNHVELGNETNKRFEEVLKRYK